MTGTSQRTAARSACRGSWWGARACCAGARRERPLTVPSRPSRGLRWSGAKMLWLFCPTRSETICEFGLVGAFWEAVVSFWGDWLKNLNIWNLEIEYLKLRTWVFEITNLNIWNWIFEYLKLRIWMFEIKNLDIWN